MDDLQTRTLLECEYRFYQVTEPSIFRLNSVQLGYKAAPPLEKLSDVELRQLNTRIRALLIKPQTFG